MIGKGGKGAQLGRTDRAKRSDRRRRARSDQSVSYLLSPVRTTGTGGPLLALSLYLLPISPGALHSPLPVRPPPTPPLAACNACPRQDAPHPPNLAPLRPHPSPPANPSAPKPSLALPAQAQTQAPTETRTDACPSVRVVPRLQGELRGLERGAGVRDVPAQGDQVSSADGGAGRGGADQTSS